MKNFLIILILLSTGCSNYFSISDEITEIKYNDIELIEKDYTKIKDLINKSKINYNKINESFDNTLVIKTKKDLFEFKISDNHIKYKENYYTNKDLLKHLKNTSKNYYNTSFFDISYTENYITNDKDTKIFLDNTYTYIILKTNQPLKNFKINLEEFNGYNYDDVDLLYSKEKINNKTIVIRKNLKKSAIKISFKNAYNNNMSILVKNENGKIIFDKQKSI